MRWLGIDAGGTKTAFATYDETLTQLGRFELPTSHYAQAGFDGCFSQQLNLGFHD